MAIKGTLRRGDRVRLTTEGVVTGFSGAPSHENAVQIDVEQALPGSVYRLYTPLSTVEKIIPPLPTKVGAVIKSKMGDAILIRTKDEWVNVANTDRIFHPSELRPDEWTTIWKGVDL